MREVVGSSPTATTIFFDSVKNRPLLSLFEIFPPLHDWRFNETRSRKSFRLGASFHGHSGSADYRRIAQSFTLRCGLGGLHLCFAICRVWHYLPLCNVAAAPAHRALLEARLAGVFPAQALGHQRSRVGCAGDERLRPESLHLGS